MTTAIMGVGTIGTIVARNLVRGSLTRLSDTGGRINQRT
jgi:Trk K+ transport system NAD-binding subunit